MIASFACHPEKTRGRFYNIDENTSARNEHERDRDRIVHSPSFRKLQNKTQAFLHYNGDHYRTRLTHSLEVAQITRAICTRLNLNVDLGEGIALAHDIGHPPFGHSGERALQLLTQHCDEVFSHNIHTLKILTLLEKRYCECRGLNLTWETIEGIAKHNGPVKVGDRTPFLIECDKKYDLRLDCYPSLEAQIASLSDDIAYTIHDIEDGSRSNYIDIEDFMDFHVFGDKLKYFLNKYRGKIDKNLVIMNALKEVMSILIQDLIEATKKNIITNSIETVEDIRACKEPIASFSKEVSELLLCVKTFLHNNLYSHYKIKRLDFLAQNLVKSLFTCFYENPICMPKDWYNMIDNRNVGLDVRLDSQNVLVVCNFVAGMTDKYAIELYGDLFNTSKFQ